MRRHLLTLGAVLGLALLIFPHASSGKEKHKKWGLAGFAKYVEIPGATRVGSDTCVSCHSEVAGNFRHAFHAQQGVQCEDCHGSGSLHVEGGGDVAKIVSFAKRSAEDANGVCLGCHAQGEKVRHWMGGSHSANHVRCADCHQVHGAALKAAGESRFSFDTATRGALAAASVSPETNVALRTLSETNDACIKCHHTEGAQLSLPYHHPLREGKMSCMDCHDPHGGPAGNNLRTANTNQLCLSCHAQYRGPFAYQHPPVTENCLNCHTAHGSPNTNLLSVSEPALCLQCHAGHHNGAGLPLTDRCTNCHGSIHGTDTPTPSGGSRFVDKSCSEVVLRASGSCDPPATGLVPARSTKAASMLRPVPSHAPTYAAGAASGALGMLAAGSLPPLSGGNMWSGNADPADVEAGIGNSAYSITPGGYRFVRGSGFLGRVGEYDTLQQSVGTNAVVAYVFPEKNLTVVSRANVLTGNDYYATTQLTLGEWLQAAFDVRSFVQQQDHYPFYAFPVLDVQPSVGTPVDTTDDFIPAHTTFDVRRRIGNAYARFKVPRFPVHLFVNGNWQTRVGVTQLAYLDENTLPFAVASCGTLCHFTSQFQAANYTTRNVGGGADVDVGPVRLTWEHKFSSFNDRLIFPTGTFTGEFDQAAEPIPFGFSSLTPPPSGPAPVPVPIGNFFINIPAPNQASSDRLNLSWTASPKLTFNGHVSYTRLRNRFTRYQQRGLNSDETLNWRPVHRLRVIADYHQQNLINDFTPFYSLYGNVSYHNHSAGVRLDYKLPKGFDVEAHYKRSGITRSNAALWNNTAENLLGSQIYSVDNTDLLKVVPSSFSNTAGLALRYRDLRHWSARAGYEWTGTHDPGFLIVPQSNNRAFANLTLTPVHWLVFTNDTNLIFQNAFPAVPLLNTPGVTPLPPPATQTFGLNIAGLPPDFQRRNRFYVETASATVRPVPGWTLGLGYSYQQNNLRTFMAFQSDTAPGYVLDEPTVLYKQISQTYWGESTYTFQKRFGLNLRVTYNTARSGFRPDLDPSHAAQLGNAFLISSGAFNASCPPICFADALANVGFAATQISQVIVPQWIGLSKVYYQFPRKFEGGFIFYYGSYRDQLNPNLNGVLRTFNVYVGRSW